MKTLNNSQIDFFQALSEIQETVVDVAMCKKEDAIEDFLYEITYETIYSMLELFDGCTKENLKYSIANIKDGNEINNGIQLHGVCPYYIKDKKLVN